MLNYKATKADYEQFRKDLNANGEVFPWFESEQKFLDNFKVNVDRETALKQIITINRKYSTHLSFGKSNAPDEGGELADYISSEYFQSRITTTDEDIAAALVMDLAKAAKTRGRFLLSFASKYCHHCNPNMFPIYDSVNAIYLRKHYSYSDNHEYKEYVKAYTLFCDSIGVDLATASDKQEGFWVDKFINNIEK